MPVIQPDSVAHAAQTIIPWVEVAKAAAWPIAALLIAVLLRAPLGRFLEGIGPRITKLSAFQVELELASGAKATTGLIVDEIRDVLGAAAVGDSSLALDTAVQDLSPADYANIFIGEGDEWLTSRLFIAAALLERMRGVRCLVFIERQAPIGRRFIALAPPSIIRWQLAQRYPWLEVAYSTAESQAEAALGGAHPPQTMQKSTTLIISNRGAFEPKIAQNIIRNFVVSLQTIATPIDQDNWTFFDSSAKWERAKWVTRSLLEDLLPTSAFDQWAVEDRLGDRGKLVKAVLTRDGEFVAVVDDEHRFKRLLNRRSYLEELAKRYDG